MPNKITGNSKANQYLILMVALAAGGGYFFWDTVSKPMVEQIDALTSQEHQLDNELTSVKLQVQRLDELRAELAQAEVDFANLQKMFPDVEQLPSRLQDLLSVTRRSGAVTTRFRPMPSVQQEHYTENNYSISLMGTYHSMGELFAEIANFPYPTSIRKMSIEVAPDIQSQLELSAEHGTEPVTVITTFEFTTFTSR